MKIKMNKVALSKMKKHFLAEYPNEACGIITTAGVYKPMHNTSSSPLDNFAFDARELCLINASAIVHSHPDYSEAPSALDIRGQIDTALPWGIISIRGESLTPLYFWGDSLDICPLVGREFRHGPSGTDNKGDCYALIRDYYRQEKKITLNEYPRDDVWWKDGKNLYTDFFADAGCISISQSEAKEGDIFFMAINSDVINHAGVYLGSGSGLILHHLAGRLSRREPLGRWVKLIKGWVRYNAKDLSEGQTC
jgi:proteasome lid subunit RPN8/RPN11